MVCTARVDRHELSDLCLAELASIESTNDAEIGSNLEAAAVTPENRQDAR
jgi:hypothetical protein